MANQTVNGTFMYFSYGSNLLRERILINNPSAKFFGVGRLQGYTLAFGSPEGTSSKRWLGGGATILKVDRPSSVYGVIWVVDNSDMKNLDRQEACYRSLQVDVELTSKTQHSTEQTLAEMVQCRTYEMPNGIGNSLPSPHYKKVILMGARQNGLPDDYISFLEQLPDNEVTEEPVGYKRVMEMLKKMNGESSR